MCFQPLAPFLPVTPHIKLSLWSSDFLISPRHVHRYLSSRYCGKSTSSATQLLPIRDLGIFLMFQPNYLGQQIEETVISRQCIYLVNEAVPGNLTIFIL